MGDETLTHDELLKALTPTLTYSPWEGLKNPTSVMPALRAVVELHKPVTSNDYGCDCEHCEFCGICAPCPTIQAIEKELG